MKMNKSKVAIVGCGLVGSTTAFSLVTQGVVDEVLMIDINKERAYGEKLVKAMEFYVFLCTFYQMFMYLVINVVESVTTKKHYKSIIKVRRLRMYWI